MGSNWNIIGYNPRGGRRMPLDNSLRAGQFRTGSVNFFPRPNYYMQVNNFWESPSLYPYDCYDDGGSSSTWKWATGLTIFGGITSGIGKILSAIWGNKSEKAEGAGSTKEAPVEDTSAKELAALKEAYKEKCTILDAGNGGYIIKDKNGNVYQVKDMDELKAKLAELYPNSDAKPVEPANEEKVEKQPEQPVNTAKTIADLYKENGLDPDSLVKSEGLEGFLAAAKDGKIKMPVNDHHQAIKSFGAQNVTYIDDTHIKIGNREYEIYKQNPDDGYVYLRDTNPTGGANNKQVYILEKGSDGTYSLHQRDFIKDKTEGYGRPAYTSRPGHWGITTN